MNADARAHTSATTPIEKLRALAEANPADPQRWIRLSSALVTSRAPEAVQQSVAAARRALEIAPESALAHAVLGAALKATGELAEAFSAWREALARDSSRPDFHAGIAAAHLAAGQNAAAASALARALELDPGDAGTCRNLALLCIQSGDQNRAKELLARLESMDRAGADWQAEAGVALSVISEGERLAPALQAAVHQRAPDSLREALASTPQALSAPDERLLDWLESLANGASAPPRAGWSPMPPEFARRIGWPVIEAHFEERDDDSIVAVERTLSEVRAATDERRQSSSGPQLRNLFALVRAIGEREALDWSGLDPLGWECRIRYFHALINAGRPAWLPGRFKPMPNKVRYNPEISRGRPEHVVGTLRAFADRIGAHAEPGLVTAALWYLLLAKLHPFGDGNGGIGRFIASAELVRSGIGPLPAPLALRRRMGAACALVEQSGRLDGLLAALIDTLRWRDKLVAGLVVRELRRGSAVDTAGGDARRGGGEGPGGSDPATAG